MNQKIEQYLECICYLLILKHDGDSYSPIVDKEQKKRMIQRVKELAYIKSEEEKLKDMEELSKM